MKGVIDIGSRRELFVDEFLIGELRGARLRLQHPERREVVLEMNRSSECPTSGYYNCFQDDGRIRLYYRGKCPGDASELQTVNYAESSDGVDFVRPELGLVEFGGSSRNNIVFMGVAGHNFHVFRDVNPACPADERYKAVGGEWEKLYGFVSADGLRWRKIRDEPLDVAGTFDSLNVAFWDAQLGMYRLFSRHFAGGVRAIQSCTSEDFIHWTRPVPHDYGPDAEPEHYYTNATIPCPGAEHILLSFPKRFMPERDRVDAGSPGYAYQGKGVSDAIFMASRDGIRWRRFREAWVRPGLDDRNWTHRSNMVAWGIIPTSPVEWSVYISEHYGWTSNRLRRLAIRPWRFASVCADYAGGELVTKPFIFSGNTLRINAGTSAAGSIRVEVQDGEGRPAAGFALADMAHWFGDALDAQLAWKGGGDLARLTGRPIRLRFELRDADLFAMQFR